MSDTSILDEGAEVEIPADPAPVTFQNTTGEVKKKRGRPPGSKNKPKEESLAPNLEGAIRGIFFLCALIAKLFGYDQTEDLTESEVKEGARSFTPIANKLPWIVTVATYIGPPIWLYTMISRKFTKRKETQSGNTETAPAENSGVSGNPPGNQIPVDGVYRGTIRVADA